MTIAIGILASDGLVIAADSQETIPGFWKVEQDKIMAAHQVHAGLAQGGIGISGAGLGVYVDELSQRWIRTFTDNPLALTVELQALLDNELEDFHERKVVPFSGYPVNERPEIYLLAACARNGWRSPWESSLNVLTDRTPVGYAAVGVGAMHARTLLGRFYSRFHFDLARAVLLAAYVLFHVKESVDGCGKRTGDPLCLREEYSVDSTPTD